MSQGTKSDECPAEKQTRSEKHPESTSARSKESFGESLKVKERIALISHRIMHSVFDLFRKIPESLFPPTRITFSNKLQGFRYNFPVQCRRQKLKLGLSENRCQHYAT